MEVKSCRCLRCRIPCIFLPWMCIFQQGKIVLSAKKIIFSLFMMFWTGENIRRVWFLLKTFADNLWQLWMSIFHGQEENREKWLELVRRAPFSCHCSSIFLDASQVYYVLSNKPECLKQNKNERAGCVDDSLPICREYFFQPSLSCKSPPPVLSFPRLC